MHYLSPALTNPVSLEKFFVDPEALQITQPLEESALQKNCAEIAPPFFPSKPSSLSFFSFRHPDNPTKENSHFYNWASTMTVAARKFHLLSEKEFANLDLSLENLLPKKSVVMSPQEQLFLEKIKGDLSFAIKENFNILRRCKFSFTPFYENPLLCIQPLSKQTLSIEDSILFKFHLKQLGLKKGHFLDLLYLPSAPCQTSYESPFKMKVALIMEDIYQALKEDKVLLNKIKKKELSVLQALDHPPLNELVKKCPTFNNATFHTIAIHIESAFEDWDLYCFKIFNQSIYMVPPRIQEYNLKRLKESYIYKHIDLGIRLTDAKKTALTILEKIYDRFLTDPDTLGSLQLFLFQLDSNQLNEHFPSWIENKALLPDDLFHESLVQINNFLDEEVASLAMRRTTLELLFDSLRNWDAFVAKTLDIHQVYAN